MTKLEEVKSTSTSENIRGVCYMILSEYDKAKAALNNAVRMDNSQTVASLNQLKKRKAIEH